MMPPGRKYVNSTLALRAEFTDDEGALTDPETLYLSLFSPSGSRVTYTYAINSEMVREAEGQFVCSFIPGVSGRWFYRWEGVGAMATVAKEGNFVIDYSPYLEEGAPAYGASGIGQVGPTTAPDHWDGADW